LATHDNSPKEIKNSKQPIFAAEANTSSPTSKDDNFRNADGQCPNVLYSNTNPSSDQVISHPRYITDSNTGSSIMKKCILKGLEGKPYRKTVGSIVNGGLQSLHPSSAISRNSKGKMYFQTCNHWTKNNLFHFN
jgi:hypothetical protein